MTALGGSTYFWLGASADADPALVSDQAASRLAASRFAPSGFDPLRWLFRQYGYEKFAILDERGTEIGFVHRRRDAQRIATEWGA